MPASGVVPQRTIARLAIYLRALKSAQREGVQTLSSARIEERTGISAAQVRRDLSYFGEFGVPGRGYGVESLLARLMQIMHLDHEQAVMIVGAGNLGTAITGYLGFTEWSFRVAAIYDSNWNKIGRRLWDLEIWDINSMVEHNREMKVAIGIIATPANAAQEVAEMMVRAGVKSILNFAPMRVQVAPGVVVHNVDLTVELQILAYFLPAPEASPSGQGNQS